MTVTRQLDKRMMTSNDKSAVKEQYHIDAVGFDDKWGYVRLCC